MSMEITETQVKEMFINACKAITHFNEAENEFDFENVHLEESDNMIYSYIKSVEVAIDILFLGTRFDKEIHKSLYKTVYRIIADLYKDGSDELIEVIWNKYRYCPEVWTEYNFEIFAKLFQAAAYINNAEKYLKAAGLKLDESIDKDGNFSSGIYGAREILVDIATITLCRSDNRDIRGHYSDLLIEDMLVVSNDNCFETAQELWNKYTNVEKEMEAWLNENDT